MSDLADVRALLDGFRAEMRRDRLVRRQGVVDAVHTGPARVDVFIGVDPADPDAVSSPDISYLASYSPTAGDTVWMLYDEGDWLVLGRIQT